MHPHLRRPLSRRTCLRAVGASLALPLFEAMLPRSATAQEALLSPTRFVASSLSYGLYGPAFFPTAEGQDATSTDLLSALEPLRGDFTVFEGLDHGVNGAHVTATSSFLSSVDFRQGETERNQPTLDQVCAQALGNRTRFASMELGVTLYKSTGYGASIDRNGVWLPRITSPRVAFASMFETGTKGQPHSPRKLTRKESVLDRVRGQAERLQDQLGQADREKLDEYFTAVRSVEARIERTRYWSREPLPEPARRLDFPATSETLVDQALMYELIALGLETDSSRVFSLLTEGRDEVLDLPGVTQGYHPLTHHGKSPEKVRQLLTIEREHMRQLAGFLARLKATQDPSGRSLLETTTVLFGSGMGNASSHSNKELPVLVAGGGIEHRGSLKYQGDRKEPLANLFVNLLQNLGVQTERFGSSTGRLPRFA